MIKTEKSAGVRIERSVYQEAMKAKEVAIRNGDARAYSTQSWFSMLIKEGLESMKKSGDTK